jgi:hypothetical protein
MQSKHFCRNLSRIGGRRGGSDAEADSGPSERCATEGIV